MKNYDPKHYRGVSFSYHDKADEKLLDESLHHQLSLLQPHIEGFCESLYEWEILDDEESRETDSRLFASLWIPLEGLGGRFRRRLDPRNFRLFELEIFVVNEETISFMVFESVTEDYAQAPLRYQEVASAVVKTAELGIKRRSRVPRTAA